MKKKYVTISIAFYLKLRASSRSSGAIFDLGVSQSTVQSRMKEWWLMCKREECVAIHDAYVQWGSKERFCISDELHLSRCLMIR